MRKILPHLIAIFHFPILMAFAFALNVGVLAFFGGAVLALATDPIGIPVAILLGLVAGRWWHLLAACLAAGVGITLLVPYVNEFASVSVLGMLARTSVLVTIAFATNLVRELIARPGRRLNESAP